MAGAGLPAVIDRVDPFERPLLQRLRSSLDGVVERGRTPVPRVADLGCGPGDVTQALRDEGLWVVGIDIDGDRLAAARAAHPHLLLVRADSQALPFRSGSMDAVVSISTLQYVDPARVIDECSRVLVAGGRGWFLENLAGNPVVALYRGVRRLAGARLAVGEDGDLVPRAHLHLDRLEVLRGRDRALCLVDVVPFHLVSPIVAPLWFPVPRAGRCARAAVSRLASVDRRLLGRWPGLGRFAWHVYVEVER